MSRAWLGVNNTNTEEEIYQKFKNYVTSPRILDVTQGMIYEIAVLVSPGVIYKTIERLKSEGINLEVVGPYEFFAYSTKRMEERGSKIIKFE